MFNKRKDKKLEKLYAKSVVCTDAETLAECLTVGHKVADLVRTRQYDELLGCLNEIRVADGYKLNIRLCRGFREEPENDEHFIGDDSYLYVSGKDGEQDQNIFNYLHVTDSYQGAWQAYILYRLWCILPHFWHGEYYKRTFIFDKRDLQTTVYGINLWSHFRHVSIDMSKYDVTPSISKNANHYFVSCCYWKDWGGLVRETVAIALENNKVTDITLLSKQVEFPYDCGIQL